MSSKTVYLISGANGDIAYGLASTLAARPNDIVFAGAPGCCRSNSDGSSSQTPQRPPSNSTPATQPITRQPSPTLKRSQAAVIIANADINDHFSPLVTTPLPASREHFEVNTLGPVVLFQAAHKLLFASPTGASVFAVISSVVGSMGRFGYISATPYGISKAAANYLVKTLDVEHPMLVAMVIQPGWVSTDMGNRGALSNGMGRSEAPVSLEDSVAGILTRIDGATKKKSSGKFWNLKVAHDNPWDVETDEVPW